MIMKSFNQKSIWLFSGLSAAVIIAAIVMRCTDPKLCWSNWIFVGLAFFFIIVWIIGVTKYLQRMIREFTFDKGDKNPYKNETLGLPPGTLRAVLTLTLLIVVIDLICLSLIMEEFRDSFSSLINAFEVMLAFYFGSRIVSNVAQKDKEKAEEQSRAQADVARAELTAMRTSNQGGGAAGGDFDDPLSVG